MYNTYMLKNKFISFSLFFIITYSASFIGGMATISFKEPWYSQLVKSNFNPPDWIFAPVWTTLYLMMTLAIWLYWHSNQFVFHRFGPPIIFRWLILSGFVPDRIT